jgi:protein-L-isoaspartate O-methyltransferase
MKKSVSFPVRWTLAILVVCLGCLGLVLWGQTASQTASVVPSSPSHAPISDSYTYRRPNPDGIGKVYMGREIAEVMGHQGSAWLERKSRSTEEQPQKMIDALNLAPTDTVAEIGAGTGYISFQLASRLPQGKVLAVDIQPEMISTLKTRIKETGAVNVEPILSTEQSPNLPPNSIDLAIMVDAYHEFNYPKEMMVAIAQALKPKGRVALVEYRAEDPRVFIKPHHKMSQAQIRKEMKAAGLTWQSTLSVLPQQHLAIFSRSQS